MVFQEIAAGGLRDAVIMPAENAASETGNSFTALPDTNNTPTLADDDDDIRFKAICITHPKVAAALMQQDNKIRAIPEQVETRMAPSMAVQMMSAIASAIAPLANTIQKMDTRFTSFATAQSNILAKLKGFKEQLGDLKMDVNDHERHLTHLNSKLHKQDALLTGYKTTNDRLVTSVRTDVNDTRAKIPELCPELMDSTVGLAMSIKEIEAIVWDLQAQAAGIILSDVLTCSGIMLPLEDFPPPGTP